MRRLQTQNYRFLASKDDYSTSPVVILGVPLELTVSFRPGTRDGPRAIRAASEVLEDYSWGLGKTLADYSYFDAGDLELPLGNLYNSLKVIEDAACKLLSDGKLPIFLGGEHLVSLPIVRALQPVYGDFAVLQFDAHADLRDNYLGEALSHATVMRRISELVSPENVFQLGVRSGNRAELHFATEKVGFSCGDVTRSLDVVLDRLGDRPVYVTLDIDVVDPAFAPGTGTPEPGGCTALDIVSALHTLGGLNVVGMDVVEVSPPYDPSGITSILASKVIREAILCWGGGKLSR